MRSFGFVLLATALVPLAAQAQSTKQVEVTNLPVVQDVAGTVEVTNDATNPVEVVGEVVVTNLPAANAPARSQLVGFTAAKVRGSDELGTFGLTLTCQAEFPNSRLCAAREIVQTTSIPEGLDGDGWVTFDSESGRPSDDCGQWTFSSGVGYTAHSRGVIRGYLCSEAHSVACCAPVP